MARKTGFLFILVVQLFKIRIYVVLWVFKFKNRFCYRLKIGFLQLSLRSVNFFAGIWTEMPRAPLLAGVSRVLEFWGWLCKPYLNKICVISKGDKHRLESVGFPSL